MLPRDYRTLLTNARSANSETRLNARNAVGLVYLLSGAIDEQIAWEEQTAREFPLNRSSRQRLVYGLLRNNAVDEARFVMEELLRIDPGDRWTSDLARLVNDYPNLEIPDGGADAEKTLQVRRNRLLWKKLPATIPETWAVEHAMSTEGLMPAPGKR